MATSTATSRSRSVSPSKDLLDLREVRAPARWRSDCTRLAKGWRTHGLELLMRRMQGRERLRPFVSIQLQLAVRMDQEDPLEERVIGTESSSVTPNNSFARSSSP